MSTTVKTADHLLCIKSPIIGIASGNFDHLCQFIVKNCQAQKINKTTKLISSVKVTICKVIEYILKNNLADEILIEACSCNETISIGISCQTENDYCPVIYDIDYDCDIINLPIAPYYVCLTSTTPT